MNSGKTFIHHDGALGDVLLSLPCVTLIKGSSTLIHFTGRTDIGRLLLDTGLAQEASPAESSFYASLYSDSLDAALIAFLNRFRQAFVFTANSNSLLASHIRRSIRQTEVIRTIPDPAERVHVGEYRLRQLGKQDGLKTNLPVPDSFREKALQLLSSGGCDRGRPIIAVHPGSGGKKKCWPLKNYLELILRMQKQGDAFVVLITGPAEEGDIKREIRELTERNPGSMPMDCEDLTTVAALLSLTALYIGNDSGVSHLAGAVNTPSLVLFGPTDPVLWKPVGKQVHVMASGDFPGLLEDITVGTVCEKALSLLKACP